MTLRKFFFLKIGLYLLCGLLLGGCNSCVKKELEPTNISNSNSNNENNTIAIKGVKIGNTTWTTCNVGDFGCFADNPHDAGNSINGSVKPLGIHRYAINGNLVMTKSYDTYWNSLASINKGFTV